MKNFISNIVAGVIAAALFAILQTNSPAILASLNTALDPVLIGSAAALILFGVCIGWLFRSLFLWHPKQRVNNDDANTHNREIIMRMDEPNKRLLKALVEKGELFCRAEDWESYCWTYSKEFLQQFVDYETIQGSRIRLKPKPNLNQFYDSNFDLFEVIDDQSIEERVVFDPDKRLSGCRYYTQELSWWWYTDDQSVKDRQDKLLEMEIGNSPITARAKRKY